jgi:hypothetical protein
MGINYGGCHYVFFDSPVTVGWVVHEQLLTLKVN